ncbi:hypothetical protein FHG64_12835 [Antarcticibacterium flavum]|uniref:Secreted protein n=1 Tax=Antarcticibacterium flavum TaxID=2058175 RepID=A0A5B7X4N0_9FLAO|nr:MULTISPECIES: hypothetical protein [Antarcticibacterium]MCM4158464.1 hypothetical protein [Antarcticibacterium sp. W02-3]QCY70220.1 hypothetical protein FHG64_12835 [Antarcticibacterium flavum]
MKTRFYKISTFLLALLVLFSTTSFTVQKHFCGTFLVDASVFGKAESCSLHAQKPLSPTIESLEEGCCNEEKSTVEGQDELQLPLNILDLDEQVFLVSYLFSFGQFFQGKKRQVVPFKNYCPPLLVYDIQLRNQIFLI